MMRGGHWRLAMCAGALAAVTTVGACKVKDPPAITAAWTDDFERADIGGDYLATSDSAYTIVAGALSAKGAFNHPLWLRKKLPDNVSIELDVWGKTPDGDLKVEVYGDGESYAVNKGAYKATGYVFVFGGWSNSKSLIARQDEHGREGADLVSRTDVRVQPGKRYHWKITISGGHVEWFIDDMSTPFLAFDDPSPLRGGGNAYFGFNNWQSDAWFDNLSITPL